MKQLYQQKRSEGFTIIEVMIVLAIAALILVVVLVAIPQLQRNQRNQARQSIAARIVTEINNYAGNNNGRYPGAEEVEWGGFVARYLDDDSTADPLTGDNIGSGTAFDAEAAIPDLEPGEAVYRTGRICNGEASEEGETRNFSYQVALEGGAVYCLDNR